MWNAACVPKVNGLHSLLGCVKLFLVAFNCHINCRSRSWEAPCKTRLLAASGPFLQFESAWFCSVNEWATWLNYITLCVPCVIGDCHFYVHAYLRKFWFIWDRCVQASQDLWQTCGIHELLFSLLDQLLLCLFFFLWDTLSGYLNSLGRGDPNAERCGRAYLWKGWAISPLKWMSRHNSKAWMGWKQQS